MTAAILPPGEVTFFDNNGLPLAGGTVQFYVPNTTTPSDTWQDAGQTVTNANPVVLDSAGRALIYGAGPYRQVVKDSLGTTIWDQVTASGSAGFASTAGTVTSATTTDLGSAGSNFVSITGTTTITSFGSSASTSSPLYFIKFSNILTLTASVSLLLPGSVNITTQTNAFAVAQYLGSGNWIVLQYANPNGQTASWSSAVATLASASTTDLGSVVGNLVSVTGTASIVGFGTSASTANPLYFVTFTGAATLTYDGTQMILPGGVNILTASGDSLLAQYLGSGHWQVLAYWHNQSTGVKAKTSDYTILVSDRNKLISANSASAIALTLPTAAAAGNGAIFYIDSINSGRCTITRASSDTFASSTSTALTSLLLSQGDRGMLISDGTSLWRWLGTRHYDSGAQTYTVGGSLTLAHGLGVKPHTTESYLVNITTEANYTSGQEALLSLGDVTADAADTGTAVVPDATNLNVRFGSTLMDVVNYTSGASTATTAAKWSLNLRAWVFN